MAISLEQQIEEISPNNHMMQQNIDIDIAIDHPIDGFTHEEHKRLLHHSIANPLHQQPHIIGDGVPLPNMLQNSDEHQPLLQQQQRRMQRAREQENNNKNQNQQQDQQEQFEKNVQSIFGIGGQDISNSNNNQQLGGYTDTGYDPYSTDYNISTSNSHDVNTSAFLTAFWLNAIVFVVLIGCYEVFRKWFPSVYSPKSTGHSLGSRSGTNSNVNVGVGDTPRSDSGMSVTSDSNPSGLTSFNVSKTVQSNRAINLINTHQPLSWIPGVTRASWSTVRSSGGLDSYMFLRYVRLCFRITFTSAIWGLIILWPVYATADGGAQGWYFLSMANITQGDSRLWIPTIFQWFTTVYVIFLMSEEYKHYLECRVDFLARGDGMVTSQQHMYSLIVERIPHELRSDRALYDYFNRLFPRKVYSTAVVLNLPDLEKESKKRKRVLRRLEKSMVSLEVRGRRPRHIVGRKRLRVCGIETSPIFSSLGG